MWNKESVQTLLLTNDRAVERALVVIYNRQTEEEKIASNTLEDNKKGFTAYDAEFLSQLALVVLSGRRLSKKQLFVIRKTDKRGNSRIGKYWKQLLEEIELKNAR